jgi:hypothetical protein
MEDTKRELLLEKRLSDLSVSALPKPEKEVKLPKRSSSSSTEDLNLTPDQYDLRDLAYEARLNTISTNAIVQKLGWKPSKIKSDVTKEMIADYQAEQMKNVNRGIYIPANLDLDLEPIPVNARGETVNQFDARRAALANQINYAEAQIKSANVRYEELAGSMYLFPGEDRELAALTNRIEQYRQTILDLQFQLDTMDARRDVLKREEDALAIQRKDIEGRNDQRRRLYMDQVKLLNSGRMAIEMLPGETSDEYKQRLEDMGATTPDQDAIQASAGLFYTDALREKLQEVLQSDADINSFIKDMSPDERYTLVKNFPLFKKNMQDVFGTQKVSADQLSRGGQTMQDAIRDLRDNLIGTINQQKSDDTKELVRQAVEPDEELPGRSDLQPSSNAKSLRVDVETASRQKKITKGQKDNLLDFIDHDSTPVYDHPALTSEAKITKYEQLRTQIDEMHTTYAPEPPPDLLVPEARPEARREARPFPIPISEEEQFTRLRDNIEARLKDIQRIDPQRQDAALQGEYEVLERLARTRNLTHLNASAKANSVDLTQYNRGAGLRRRHAKIVQFGRVDIHPQRLFYDNVLKVTKNGRSITGMANTKVSDAFASVVMSVLSNKTPTMKDFTKMSADEKKLYDTLIIASGLQKDIETVGSGVKEDLKRRLALIEGEVEAGNTNPLLIKEARQVLHRMAQMKMVSRPKAVAHLKQLQAFQ